jgi:hypothetical protein
MGTCTPNNSSYKLSPPTHLVYWVPLELLEGFLVQLLALVDRCVCLQR